MIEKGKIVEFHKWCEKCKHYEKTEAEDPCFDCLSDPWRVGSHKPTKYEEKEEK